MYNEILSVDKLNFGEDYVTSPRICYFCHKIVKVEKPLYHYVRFNNSSYTHLINQKTFDDLIYANKLLDNFFKDKLDIPKSIIERSKIYNKITMLYVSPKSFYCIILLQLCWTAARYHAEMSYREESPGFKGQDS